MSMEQHRVIRQSYAKALSSVNLASSLRHNLHIAAKQENLERYGRYAAMGHFQYSSFNTFCCQHTLPYIGKNPLSSQVVTAVE